MFVNNSNNIYTMNSTAPLEEMSYKELQGLAMALNLPGKMKVSFHIFNNLSPPAVNVCTCVM